MQSVIDFTNTSEVLKFNLKQANEQGQAIVQILEHMEEMERKGEEREEKSEERYVEITAMVKELKDTKTLDCAQQYILKEEYVHVKGKALAREFLGDDYYKISFEEKKRFHALFYKKIWARMRKRYKAARWFLIRGCDFEEAKKYVTNLTLLDFDLD